MKNVFEEYFSAVEYPIFPRDYFTAKNVVTGKIEQTGRTFTIHHFATQYHSEEWKYVRAVEQKIYSFLGEKTLAAKLVKCLYAGCYRIKREGIGAALRYYYKKYIHKPA
jgi:hypothetical protein